MKFLQFTFALLFSAITFGQDLDLQWSDTRVYSKKEDGFHKYFLGTTDDYIYSFSGAYLKQNKNVILCNEKETLKQVYKLDLTGSEDEKREAELEEMDYLRTIVIDNKLHVFWQKGKTKRNSNSDREIFVETYDEKLNLVEELHSIIKYDEEEIGQLSILSSKGEKKYEKENGIVLINAYKKDKDSPTTIQVAHFDAKMEEISEEEYKMELSKSDVDQPGVISGSGDFTFEEDGNLYLNSTFTETTKKGVFKRSYKYYSVIAAINLYEKNMEVTEFKDDNKDIYSLRIVSKENGNYLMGFFRDLKKENSGGRTHGIFSAKINIETGVFEEPSFSYFSKEILDNLFAEDVDDRKASRKISKKKREEENAKNEESISYNYVIEQTGIGPKGELLLVCSSMYNYTVTVCTTNSNGTTSCREVPYCNKKNVTVFALNKAGDIEWSKNIDRNITYSGHYIYDVEMVEKKGKFYIIYGGNNAMDLEGLSKREKKELADRSDNFSYGVLDPKTKSLEANSFKIEQVSDKKKDQRYVQPANIRVFDNVFYTDSEVSQVKIGPTVGLCAGSMVCPPLLLFFVFSKEAFRKTTGQLGKIEPVD